MSRYTSSTPGRRVGLALLVAAVAAIAAVAMWQPRAAAIHDAWIELSDASPGAEDVTIRTTFTIDEPLATSPQVLLRLGSPFALDVDAIDDVELTVDGVPPRTPSVLFGFTSSLVQFSFSGSVPVGALIELEVPGVTNPADAGDYPVVVETRAGTPTTSVETVDVVVPIAEEPGRHTLTVVVEGDGRVQTSTPRIDCPPRCSSTFNEGAVVPLEATAGEGSHFVAWCEFEQCDRVAPVIDVVMDQERTITARFALDEPDPVLTVALVGSGAGVVTSDPSGIDCPDTCDASFAPDATVALTAVPHAGSIFGGWQGESCTGEAATIVVAMTGDLVCTATFILPVATDLTAEPALLQVQGGLLGLRVRLLDLEARLVRADTRAPLAGETVTMRVERLVGGSQVVCTAVTDADGVASCSATLGSLLGLLLNGYSATFAGSEAYEPSSASAPLLRIDVGG